MLFGVHGRQDAAAAELRCVNPITRQVAWKKSGFGYATMILAGDKLLIMKTDGELVLAAADTKQYRELSRANLFDDRVTTRALPSLSNGLFYRFSDFFLRFFLYSIAPRIPPGRVV